MEAIIEITEKQLSVDRAVVAVTHPGAGAINIFMGTIRDSAKGKKVTTLEYEAYETMAKAEIEKILHDAFSRWPLLRAAVFHRIGTLHPGEVAVVVAVATPHRHESFEAGRFIMDEIKAKAPIFKKEILEGDEEWVGAF